jgi:hypothetical protein
MVVHAPGTRVTSSEEAEWLRLRAKTQTALAIVLDRLALLDTPAASNLRTMAESAVDATRVWGDAPPMPQRQAWHLKRVISLLVATGALERHSISYS